eukprot:TRINITY_DN21585_c0_g1_i1.p1 TRINITY_DN21585_c0_g1~~TRINITY_DN21585_c0_g1_i1.p1  ORF type:complete len:346 (-),score=37.99 TRINITY_DN21585_c0_g1_i1:134-1171(-)
MPRQRVVLLMLLPIALVASLCAAGLGALTLSLRGSSAPLSPCASEAFRQAVQYAREARKEDTEFYADPVRFTIETVPDASNISREDFQRLVTRSTPAIIRNTSCTSENLTLDFLRGKIGSRTVEIEVSEGPEFYSDAARQRYWDTDPTDPKWQWHTMRVDSFLDIFQQRPNGRYYYLAEPLERVPEVDEFVEVPPFADHLSLTKAHLWVGGGGEVAPLHQDGFDNIFCQLQGERIFTLYHPLQSPWLYPSPVDPHFALARPLNSDLRVPKQNTEGPSKKNEFPLAQNSRFQRVTVKPGEVLYLPSYWWHEVDHSPGVGIAVNFWFEPHVLLDTVYGALMAMLVAK